MSASPAHTGGLEGALLGERYRVQQRIGGGGFGVVYQAEHALTGRNFAIKVLRSELGERPKLVERFVREATTTARIEHENVVDIIDVGRTDDGLLYFAMELLRGETLEDTLLREARLPWRRVRAIGLQICDGLRAAHDRGIVHRDLKPANIYRVRRGGDPDTIKILDFGIAKLLDDDAHGKSSGTGGLTSNYEVLGTPLYMSPEQTAADPVDQRTDIYAVGVMMFEMLTGQRPYRGDTHVELISKILIGQVPRMSEVAPDAEIPEALELIVATALAKNPQQRYQDMNAMMRALSSMDGEMNPTRIVRHPATEPLASLAPGDTLLAPTHGHTNVEGSSVRWSRGRRRSALIAGSLIGLLVLALGVFAAVPPITTKPEPQQLVQAEPEPEGMTPLAVTNGRWPEAVSLPSAAAIRQPALRRVPACEAALGSALQDLPGAVLRRCSRNTGVTSGDRMKLQLAGGAGGKLEVKVLAGSGSRDFDGCLTQALGQRRLPANTRPTRCTRAMDYRVP
jgi:serine/threonine-protein kinase